MSLYSMKIPQKIESYGKERTLPGNTLFITRNMKQDSLFSHKETPRCFHFPGAFTLEAAVILPLLTSFFVSILFFFRVMEIEIAVQKALDDTGRQMAVCTTAQGAVTDIVAAQALFFKELGETDIPDCYIRGGKFGISLLSSEFNDREIQLRACYQIQLPVRIFWIWEFSMEQRADCRKWIGWVADTESDTADDWVYVAETGSVYHRRSTCSHLDLSIRSVGREQVEYLRNESGGKYYRCIQCANQTNAWGTVYITNQGACYHNDLNCSGIKRTVYMIRLSEVGARTACRRCTEVTE